MVRLEKRYQWTFKLASLVIFAFATLVAWQLPNDTDFDEMFYARLALGLVLGITLVINVIALVTRTEQMQQE